MTDQQSSTIELDPAVREAAERAKKAVEGMGKKQPKKPKATPRVKKELTPEEKAIKAEKQAIRYRNQQLRKIEAERTRQAIEEAKAKEARSLGFLNKTFVVATLPHKKPPEGTKVYKRKNGDLTLSIATGLDSGLPYGTLPRLLLIWICTEAVKTQSRHITLGRNLSDYLDTLGLNRSGGSRGDITRLKQQLEMLLGCTFTLTYSDGRRSALSNTTIADKVNLWQEVASNKGGNILHSEIRLSEQFFEECKTVVPFDMRAVSQLKKSTLEMDIYIWLTFRMSSLSNSTVIPWDKLAEQFGSNYSNVRDFKKAFTKALKNVTAIYDKAIALPATRGLALKPSPTHVPQLNLDLGNDDFPPAE